MGAGGLGSYFGGLLYRSGEDVTFIARGDKLAALRDHGLTVRLLPDGEFQTRPAATDDPRDVGAVDLILFSVKTYDIEQAARACEPMVGPTTVIMPVQNGVDAAERIAAILGNGHVIGGVSRGGATLEAPGRVSQKSGRTPLPFGELDGSITPRCQRLLDTFLRAGIDAELTTRIRTIIWEKFAATCAFLGVTAVTRLPIGPIVACPATMELHLGLALEAEEIGIALGVEGLRGYSAGYQERTYQLSAPANRGSMYFDMIAGKRLELEDLNGAAVRMGREVGVPTPLNFAVYAALKPFADGPPALP
jgi:2-dehydropantoate 2-reductase